MLNSQKNKFDLDPNIHYLNCAAYGPILKSSAEAGKKGIEQKMHPNQITSISHFTDSDTARGLFAELINCGDPDSVAIISSASYGLAIVAANLETQIKGKNKKTILAIGDEFPNDFYAFEKVAKKLNLEQNSILKPPGLANIGQDWNQNILNAINTETALIVLPHIHWKYGVKFDLEQISKKCIENDVLLVIDGSQSIGIEPFDNTKIKADAIICPAYKWLLGPYSIGFAYFGEKYNEGTPLEETWMNREGSDDFTTLSMNPKAYRPKAQRYNMGEFSQFIQIPMLIDSLTQILAWKPENMKTYIEEISLFEIKKLRNLGCEIVSEAFRAKHLFGISLPKNVDKQSFLNALKGKNVLVSDRGDVIRISINVFNEKRDLEILTETLEECL
jgi:selenocysteine lyase/cysteine desulfurase